MDKLELGNLSTTGMIKLTSFLFWSSLYLWCSIKVPKETPEWCSRIVTLLHGSVATLVGLSQCDINTLSECTLTMKIAPHHFALMAWSWGYFAFDLLWCLIYWTDSLLMLCHHASALIAITIYMQKDFTGCTFACTLAMMEITNPFLQPVSNYVSTDQKELSRWWRVAKCVGGTGTYLFFGVRIWKLFGAIYNNNWFLKNEGYGQTIIYYVVEVVYLTMFIGIRGILGTYILYRILTSDIFDMDEKLITLVFYIVSLAFIYQICGYIIYRYKSQIGEFNGILDELDYILNEQQ